MNASKEDCRKAIDAMEKCKVSGFDGSWFSPEGSLTFVLDFLKVAEKRLPSEESIAKDKERKKPPKNKSTNRTLKGGLS